MEVLGSKVAAKQTLVQLATLVTETLKHKKYDGARLWWDHMCEPVVLSEPYRMFLTHDANTGYWKLSDISGTLPCIIRGQNTSIDPMNITVTSFELIAEIFQETSSDSPQDIKCYVILNSFIITRSNPSRIVEMLPQVDCYVKNLKCVLCQRTAYGPQEEACHSLKGIQLKPYNQDDYGAHTHVFQIHYKSTPQILPRFSPPHCFVVASLLNTQMHEDNLGLLVLIFQGSLFPIVSLLQTNGVYNLHFQSNFPLHDCRSIFARNMQMFPWIVLPSNTAFSYHDCPCWSGPQMLIQVPGLVHLTGKIFSRQIWQPKFSDQVINHLILPGYGVPRMKTVMLEIYFDANCTKSTCVYLNKWGGKLYPLGLLPGAMVTLFNMKRRMSQTGTEYFEATELTGFYVENMSPCMVSTWSGLTDVSELSDARKGSIICGIVNVWKLLRAEILHICLCGKQRIYGVCPNVTCAAQPHQFSIVTRARIITYGCGGPIMIHLKDNNVRLLLSFSKKEWHILLQLSLTTPICFNSGNLYKPSMNSYMMNVFHAYCLHPRKNVNLFLKCRMFNKDQPMSDEPDFFPKSAIPQIFALELHVSLPEGAAM